MGQIIFGVSYQYGYHSYISRITESLAQLSAQDVEHAYDLMKSECVGLLLDCLQPCLELVESVTDLDLQDKLFMGCSMFATQVARKMLEKTSFEPV